MNIFRIAFLAAVLIPQAAYAQPACVNTERVHARAEKAADWLPEVRVALADAGLPAKWIYLMLEESGGNPAACSAVGACGPWQLTSATARHYGCADRNDPTESTRAAARYINKLLQDFDGDEARVVMAYNMGGSNLRKYGPTREAKALSALVMCAFDADPLHLIGD